MLGVGLGKRLRRPARGSNLRADLGRTFDVGLPRRTQVARASKPLQRARMRQPPLRWSIFGPKNHSGLVAPQHFLNLRVLPQGHFAFGRVAFSFGFVAVFDVFMPLYITGILSFFAIFAWHFVPCDSPIDFLP